MLKRVSNNKPHMFLTTKDKIKQKAVEILKQNTQGVRYSELVRSIREQLQDTNINTIHGTVWDLDRTAPKEVYKAERGLFKHVDFGPEVIFKELPDKPQKVFEEKFYQPFADYLSNELEECTKAIPLGRNKFKDKWGTPDVIGLKEPSRSDIIKPEITITSAEIKTEVSELITAFGQACAYKSFSHRVYIVIPKSSNEEDKSRIESLCLIFGIGLILFDVKSVEDPNFEIRVRPIKHEPDSFYINKYLKLIEKELFT